MDPLEELINKGFTSIENIYTKKEVGTILRIIDEANTDNVNFRKSSGLFAIRQFLKEIPATIDTIFNEKLTTILTRLLGPEYFVVKSIYFDKPQSSNWYVSYHQDLTISVDKKIEIDGFDNWTNKHNQFAVQPPLAILENIVTVRIHLDDTNENNGALNVIPKSHLKGIYRADSIDWTVEQVTNCNVSQGGIMLMRPLLLHSSGRTTNKKQRRVIHLEFSNSELPTGIHWSERLNINSAMI